ncbi:hypothetical protein KCN56_09005 [Photobacterium galatheae]|uniref:hypothetical protein n=1 Tax=Photobacterium galatheae TaxID=1654360 RepID=UPI00202CF3B3|nr:hypothetical protein [Photobacterium galatheae]MCM0148696.1 hypothetical protein [Photobacterium galatheae]
MGDTSHFLGSIILGIPLCITMRICARNLVITHASFSRFLFLISLVFSLLALSVWIPDVWRVTILGHHLCGNEYHSHSYSISNMTVERFIPVVNLLLVLFMIQTIVSRAFMSRKHDKQEEKHPRLP